MIPFRLCCGKQHLGVVCPDNMVMCCYCFDRFEFDELAIDNGELVDICQSCWDWEQEHLADKERFYEDHEGRI